MNSDIIDHVRNIHRFAYNLRIFLFGIKDVTVDDSQLVMFTHIVSQIGGHLTEISVRNVPENMINYQFNHTVCIYSNI